MTDGQLEWLCEFGASGTISLKQKRGRNADCEGGHAFGTTIFKLSRAFLAPKLEFELMNDVQDPDGRTSPSSSSALRWAFLMISL